MLIQQQQLPARAIKGLNKFSQEEQRSTRPRRHHKLRKEEPLPIRGLSKLYKEELNKLSKRQPLPTRELNNFSQEEQRSTSPRRHHKLRKEEPLPIMGLSNLNKEELSQWGLNNLRKKEPPPTRDSASSARRNNYQPDDSPNTRLTNVSAALE